MKKITLLLSAMLFAMMSFAATTVTMDFTSKAGLDKLGIAYPADTTGTDGAYQTELVAGQAYTQEGVSLTATHGKTPTRVWLAASGAMDLRHYKTGVLTFAAPAGKVVLKVKMAGGNVADFTDVTGGVWTGEAATVALTAKDDAKTIKISTIEVTYGTQGETLEPEDPKDTELVIPEEAKAWNIPAEAIDVLKAREICAGLASGETTGTKYYVMGYVKKIHSKHADGVANYGNAQFYMENVKGANSSEDFIAFQVYGPNGKKITDPAAVEVGDFVVVYGELTNYMGDTYETVGKGAAYIWKSTNPLCVEPEPEPVEVTVFDIDLGTKGKVDTFAIADLAGSGTWKYARTTTNMRTEMKGANSEDWLITPALDLTGMLEASLNFKYKFSAAIPTENQHQYTVLISNDYDGNVANVNNATWIEIKGFPYDVTAYAESGLLSIPAEMLVGTCHIAWKYKTADTAHTWSLKNITVKGMKFLD